MKFVPLKLKETCSRPRFYIKALSSYKHLSLPYKKKNILKSYPNKDKINYKSIFENW